MNRKKKQSVTKRDKNVKDTEPSTTKDLDAPKRGKGRPSAAIQSSETGEQISDYKLWYHKSKRKHPERKIVGSSANAIAVIPKGKKYLVDEKTYNKTYVWLVDEENEPYGRRRTLGGIKNKEVIKIT